MAGLEGAEQPRPYVGRAPGPPAGPRRPGIDGRGHARPVDGVRRGSAVDDDGASKGRDPIGDPSLEEVQLPSRPESAGTARRLTQAVLHRQWVLSPQLTEHAVLLVSELVGNAVRHTGARSFGLRMMRRRGWIRIEVRDPSRGLPCLMPVQDLDTSGRGLFLVDKLSDRWGVDLLPRGKTTWFEMRVSDR